MKSIEVEINGKMTPVCFADDVDNVIAEKNAIIEEQAKEIKFMHKNCKHGESCVTSCAQIHGELMQATTEVTELRDECAELHRRVSTLLSQLRIRDERIDELKLEVVKYEIVMEDLRESPNRREEK